MAMHRVGGTGSRSHRIAAARRSAPAAPTRGSEVADVGLAAVPMLVPDNALAVLDIDVKCSLTEHALAVTGGCGVRDHLTGVLLESARRAARCRACTASTPRRTRSTGPAQPARQD